MYKLYSFPDHDTPIISNSTSPHFADHHTFPLSMGTHLDHYLKTEVRRGRQQNIGNAFQWKFSNLESLFYGKNVHSISEAKIKLLQHFPMCTDIPGCPKLCPFPVLIKEHLLFKDSHLIIPVCLKKSLENSISTNSQSVVRVCYRCSARV